MPLPKGELTNDAEILRGYALGLEGEREALREENARLRQRVEELERGAVRMVVSAQEDLNPWIKRAEAAEDRLEKARAEAMEAYYFERKLRESAEARLAKVVEVLRTTHLHLIALADYYPQEQLIVNLRDSLAVHVAALAAAKGER